METTEGLRNQIRTAEDLQSFVKTMKGLAAVSIRQYQRAVESLEEYSRTVELGFRALLRGHPEILTQPGSPSCRACAAVVFGSDQGMCGPLNREIAAHAVDSLAQLGADRTLVAAVGARVKMELEGVGQEIAEAFAPPSSIAQLTESVEDVLVTLERWREERGVARIVLFRQQPLAAASYKPRTVHLLPLDLDWLRALAGEPWPTNKLPIFCTSWEGLFASLVRQHLFAALFRAFAESLASENASRLAAMQAAEKNIEERIDKLHASFHQLRQANITEELLDVIAGFEVLKKEAR